MMMMMMMIFRVRSENKSAKRSGKKMFVWLAGLG